MEKGASAPRPRPAQKNHSITLDNRQRAALTGVSEVLAFDEGQVILMTEAGEIIKPDGGKSPPLSFFVEQAMPVRAIRSAAALRRKLIGSVFFRSQVCRETYRIKVDTAKIANLCQIRKFRYGLGFQILKLPQRWSIER